MFLTAFNKRAAKRAGTMYIAVMGVTTIVGMMALAAAAVGRLHVRGVASQAELREAQLLAQSGVEYGTNYILTQPNWRTTLSSGVEQASVTLGSGSMAWVAEDADGDFDDDHADFIALRGIGRVGDTIAVEEVLLEPTGGPISSLNAALHVDGPWDANDRTITTDGEVSSNGFIDVFGSSLIVGDAWATSTIASAANITGTRSPNQFPERQMPTNAALEYYKARGTWIDITDLPNGIGTRNFTKQVMSPANNPFGTATNPEGIYVIDCGGEDIDIRYNRLVCTLVLLSPGSGSQVKELNNWSPAVANYPALLVSGSLTFDMEGILNGTMLREDTQFTNFNPVGTPFEGEQDSDFNDTYPSEINGLVYVSGTLNVIDDTYFTGVVLCNALTLGDDATFNYDVTLFDYPPSGFRTGDPMRIVPGTWRRAAY